MLVARSVLGVMTVSGKLATVLENKTVSASHALFRAMNETRERFHSAKAVKQFNGTEIIVASSIMPHIRRLYSMTTVV